MNSHVAKSSIMCIPTTFQCASMNMLTLLIIFSVLFPGATLAVVVVPAKCN